MVGTCLAHRRHGIFKGYSSSGSTSWWGFLHSYWMLMGPKNSLSTFKQPGNNPYIAKFCGPNPWSTNGLKLSDFYGSFDKENN